MQGLLQITTQLPAPQRIYYRKLIGRNITQIMQSLTMFPDLASRVLTSLITSSQRLRSYDIFEWCRGYSTRAQQPSSIGKDSNTDQERWENTSGSIKTQLQKPCSG